MINNDLNSEAENTAMQIIAYSGEGRSKAFKAMKLAEEGDFTKANKLIKESKDDINLAHTVQSKMMAEEAKGKHISINLLTVHAQDHFMTGILANELISEMIRLQKEISDLKRKQK